MASKIRGDASKADKQAVMSCLAQSFTALDEEAFFCAGLPRFSEGTPDGRKYRDCYNSAQQMTSLNIGLLWLSCPQARICSSLTAGLPQNYSHLLPASHYLAYGRHAGLSCCHFQLPAATSQQARHCALLFVHPCIPSICLIVLFISSVIFRSSLRQL